MERRRRNAVNDLLADHVQLAAGVITAICAEFLRGAIVVRTQTGKNLLASTVLLVRRNTRRYGGYIVHFGIVVMFIGIAGGAFNQSREQEMSYRRLHDHGAIQLGLPELHAGLQAELRHGVSRCLTYFGATNM